MGTARRDKNKGRSQGLTEEQKQEIREAFDLFDTDGSGMTLIEPLHFNSERIRQFDFGDRKFFDRHLNFGDRYFFWCVSVFCRNDRREGTESRHEVIQNICRLEIDRKFS